MSEILFPIGLEEKTPVVFHGLELARIKVEKRIYLDRLYI